MATHIKDLSSLDWDDSALQKAYDKGLKLRKKYTENMQQKSKNSKESSKHGEKWKKGDFCRAIFPVDDKYYEAQILSINKNKCTIEFIGYGDNHEVHLLHLEPSLGKKARKSQKQEAAVYTAEYFSPDSESAILDIGSKDYEKETVRDYEEDTSKNYAREQFRNTKREPSKANVTYMRRPSAPPPLIGDYFNASNLPFPIPEYSSMPFLSKLPPPMPHCSNISQDPSITALLVSWYMAGYYTGFHQGQKSCQYVGQCCHH